MADSRSCWRCNGDGRVFNARRIAMSLNDGSLIRREETAGELCEKCGGSGKLPGIPSPQYVAPDKDPA